MDKRLIFMVADPGYLVPTVVAALQIASQAEVMRIADLRIYLAGFSASEIERLNAAFQSRPFEFEELAPSRIEADESVEFVDSHVSRAALGRLVVATQIPDIYEHLLYLDGDIQIAGDLLPLVRHDVAPGFLLAAPDSTMLMGSKSGAMADDTRAYLGRLGLVDASIYFNSGVLAARRKTWIDISRRALTYFFDNSAACRYHDQSALNAVASDKREPLHPRYNAMPAYMRLNSNLLDPRIVHFIGARKPWHDDGGADWMKPYRQAYGEVLRDYPVLDGYRPKGFTTHALPRPKALKRLKDMLATPRRRARFERYLRSQGFVPGA